MPQSTQPSDAERDRLEAAKSGCAWRKWGPYLSERQWGTVREDYSPDGNAWDYFSHDQARSRAYRWGEDGLAGISDDHQRLCVALALWNGRDPILKERLFGLTNAEGNHGEDVKEYYYYLDSTPTHSYLKYLYKYPQSPFPYGSLIENNATRTRDEFEYELIDTGVFDDNRYFDVFVEVAKRDVDELVYHVTVCNRGAEDAEIHVLPTVWFRNTWQVGEGPRPRIHALDARRVLARHDTLGDFYVHFEGSPRLLFTDNETNTTRLFGTPPSSRWVKDGIHDCVIGQRSEAVNADRVGTKMAAHYHDIIPGGGERVFRLSLAIRADAPPGDDALVQLRRGEADEFYASLRPPHTTDDEADVFRQALAGMLWSKQYYNFDVEQWLHEHGVGPLDENPHQRNREWFHMINDDIISMPDKWEYPWYAAWDLAFHTIALGAVDLEFAKRQLLLVLSEPYLHPNGQVPAYEWNFSDVNPPVHAWAGLFLYNLEKGRTGKGDLAFLTHFFNKLMLNFSWWVNRKDLRGRNVFGGGFLGLDNIGIIDRSAPMPAGGELEQADGTGWMALFSECMLQICMELALHDAGYASLAVKYADHFLWILNSLNRLGEEGMWDEEDGFFYDVLRLPDGSCQRLRVRSLVGLLPLCATTVFSGAWVERFPEAQAWMQERLSRLSRKSSALKYLAQRGQGERRCLSLVDAARLRRILQRLLDPQEFLSDYGLRSLSKYHEAHPCTLDLGGAQMHLRYEPAESSSAMYGGNSNWRGPIWFPANVLIIRALINLYMFYGNDFEVECPTGSGHLMNLYEVSREITRRLVSIFTRDNEGRRAVFGGASKFQEDPHWRDHVLFYEFFHGDNGAGLGASHQTGWTGLIAPLLALFARTDPEVLLERGTLFAHDPA